MRVSQGWYQFNPRLLVRRRQSEEEVWQPIYAALNLPLINEFASDYDFAIESVWDRIGKYCAMAEIPKPAVPIPAERAIARQVAAEKELAAREAEQLAALQRWQKEQQATKQRKTVQEPKWGTPEAKRREIERLLREIEAKKK